MKVRLVPKGYKAVTPPARWGGQNQAHQMTPREALDWAIFQMHRHLGEFGRTLYIIPLDPPKEKD